MPRHPPCALSSLSCYKDARVHCVVLKLRAVPPKCLRLPAADESVQCREFAGAMARERSMTRSLRTQQCAWPAFALLLEVPLPVRGRGSTDERSLEDRPNNRRSTSERGLPKDVCLRNRHWTDTDQGPGCRMLLRKEVIQPHLPVRLPCYDFVPIASPTFDGSLHKGWATGFGCCRLS